MRWEYLGVKEWRALTDCSQAQRLRTLVADFLPAYGLEGSRVRLLEAATNVVFRIDAPDISISVLKVDVEEDYSDAHMDIALDWLAAINIDTGIPVVQLVKSDDGTNYVRPTRRLCRSTNGVRCIGGFVAACSSTLPQAYGRLGELTAQLINMPPSSRQ